MFIAGVITAVLIITIACAVVPKWKDDKNECKLYP